MKEGAIVFLLVAFLVWGWFADANPNVVKAYVLNCHSWKLDSGTSCPGEDWRHERVITYALWPDQSRVVVDSGLGQTYTVSGCSIIDSEHWECEDSVGLKHDFGCRPSGCFDAYDTPWEKRVGALRYYSTRFLDLFQSD